jgi:hypothetical protein
MKEEDISLLSPTDPDLKDSKRCAYKEGKNCHRDKLDPFSALDKGVELVKATGKPGCNSFEAMFYFTQGIMGEKCEIQRNDWMGRDYCKEGCKLECEYRNDNIQTS